MSRPFASRRAAARAEPLDAARLQALAIAYVGRYATTRAKLATYLRGKLRTRGWEGESEPPVEAIVQRCADFGYVDDAAFASARGASLGRRGYGAGRVSAALRAAGVEEADAAPARAAADEGAYEAAVAFARRKRIGPFAREEGDPDTRRKALAAMLRAGHPRDLARKLVFAERGASLDER